MSFGINGPDNIPSIQKSHHTNDGGAGNLGYFQRERKKKKQDDDEQDVFELSSGKKEENPLMEDLDSIGTKIKNFWKSLHENFNDKEENNPEEQ